MNVQKETPLYDALIKNKQKSPLSFHVPGHKYGQVFPEKAKYTYEALLSIDATEITGLDDLHAPDSVIKKAQKLASLYFESDATSFLVNGTTVGNMAMVLSVCNRGDEVIVQRNCHKSVMNGLELAGAKPVFLSSEYEEATGRYSKVTAESVRKGITEHPNAKAVFLTYPDYFGRTYPIKDIIDVAHAHDLPLLVDEAHGVHFHLGSPFPYPSLKEGADAVVQSAHKMAPAMTMASFIHIKGNRVNKEKLNHYLQILQSSSPSYPLMASLDLARYYLANWDDKKGVFKFIEDIRTYFKRYHDFWDVLPLTHYDDPLKMTLSVKRGSGFEVAQALEDSSIVPEMATTNQVLLTFGLEPAFDKEVLKERLSSVYFQLKNLPERATIKQDDFSLPSIQTLEMSYPEMQEIPSYDVNWKDAVGLIAAEAVIPYPPGIPLLMKGERISKKHIELVRSLQGQGAKFQNGNIAHGIRVFKGE
ncbi:aminotransferase class I/II-fold pyridoxal phosphate-dependent enzyme [Halobacillus yeomjeoni]|uniref:aminotransferase class I/II-fold pyridoxal phosphate-dependent enzyme n=1 Tax=Halobacillus yeomjeoni TaxID=311194 RepID=UPI001CD6A540|nr:aminotransferase class I/II-fold pyridoxal phosphate-dependent enzyme [Halobacillus yeomjeoni]MCA0985658.1 aminotransferase class I/II-fold pyridoxal phosphate-dependent enzyme [Halobacillus yeomjeoni]